MISRGKQKRNYSWEIVNSRLWKTVDDVPQWRSTIFDTIPFESKVQGSSNLTAGKGEIEKAKFSDIAVDRAFESTRVPPINPCS